MYNLYSRKILEGQFSIQMMRSPIFIAYEESDIISTEELEESAERIGNTLLLYWKQCALYPLLCSTGHSRYMTMYYVSSGVCVCPLPAYLHVVLMVTASFICWLNSGMINEVLHSEVIIAVAFCHVVKK